MFVLALADSFLHRFFRAALVRTACTPRFIFGPLRTFRASLRRAIPRFARVLCLCHSALNICLLHKSEPSFGPRCMRAFARGLRAMLAPLVRALHFFAFKSYASDFHYYLLLYRVDLSSVEYYAHFPFLKICSYG